MNEAPRAPPKAHASARPGAALCGKLNLLETPTVFGCGNCGLSERDVEADMLDSPVQLVDSSNGLTSRPPAAPPQPTSKTSADGAENALSATEQVEKAQKAQALPFWQSFGHRMDEDEVLNRAWWCWYCCCGGCGCTNLKAPLDCKCQLAMCSLSSEAIPCCDPSACTCIGTVCCCTWLSQWPLRPGNPRCVLLGDDLCGVVGGVESTKGGPAMSHSSSGGSNGSITDSVGFASFDNALAEMFLPCWCGCCGLGAASSFIACCSIFSKCGCCLSRCNSNIPDLHEGLCGCLVQAWWLLAQCRLPPKIRSNPICACLGQSYKTYTHHAPRV